jgi:hypothetical protein
VIRRATTLLLIALAVALTIFASPATAATPCWKRLVNDWYDGRIDKAYSVACYRAAIKNLPEDVRAYSDARDDITRALNQAIRKQGAAGVKPEDVIQPQRPTGNTGGETESETQTNGGIETTPVETSETETTAAPPANGNDDGGPLGWIEPSNADSIPLPLLILAALALLLLALAGGSYVAKRVQARRLRLMPRPPEQP